PSRPLTNRQTAMLRPGGRWTTNCTPPWPPVGTSPPGPAPTTARCPAPRRRRRRNCPPSGSPSPGWTPSAPTCTPPPTTPPPAAADSGDARGRSRFAIAIPDAMPGFLAAGGHWNQSAALRQAALASARQAGDQLGEADTLNTLGALQRETGDYPAAAASLAQA